MITIKNGNLLSAQENILCQQVNCKGVMGAGLAKQIRDTYPNVFKSYLGYIAYNNRDSHFLLGKVLPVKIGHDKFIFNLFAQDKYGRNKEIYTDYKALKLSLEYTLSFAGQHKYSVAFPYMISCGLAGGDWEGVVYPMIREIFGGKIDVVIYRYGK